MAVRPRRRALFALPFLLIAGPLDAARTEDRMSQPAQDPRLQQAQGGELIPLPAPSTDGTFSVERALATRRSVRTLSGEALTLREVSQLLWAGQGVTQAATENRPALRTAPSAGALYPLELYAVVTSVQGLEAGVYRYVPSSHALVLVARGERREAMGQAALRQAPVLTAPVTFAVTGVVARSAARYRDRAPRYVHMEVGAVVENMHLQVSALGLGTVWVGAFQDEAVRTALGLPQEEDVLSLLPVGRLPRS